jgi:hypothetical protein
MNWEWKNRTKHKCRKSIFKFMEAIVKFFFRTQTKLKVALLFFSGSPYLYKQELSSTNDIKSDLWTALRAKQCWLKYLSQMIRKQVDWWRHQCRLQFFKLVSIFWRKFGPRWKKIFQPQIFSPNLTASLLYINHKKLWNPTWKSILWS